MHGHGGQLEAEVARVLTRLAGGLNKARILTPGGRSLPPTVAPGHCLILFSLANWRILEPRFTLTFGMPWHERHVLPSTPQALMSLR